MLSTGEKVDLEIHHKPSWDFALAASAVGQRAWENRFEDRINRGETIRTIFDINDPELLLRQMQAGRRKAGKWVGALAIAYDGEGQEAVGFAWAANDLSGNAVVRLGKRSAIASGLTHKKPWAWLAQINTKPRIQGEGVGTALLRATMADFDRTQPAATYILEENTSTRDWAERRGYAATPDTQEVSYYFGPNAEPARLQRYTASLDTILLATATSESVIDHVITCS